MVVVVHPAHARRAPGTGVSTDTHPRVVPVLSLLAYVYCRTARHTFGEGLLRECAKILKVWLEDLGA